MIEFPVSELRWVRMAHHTDGKPHSYTVDYLVRADQVDILVEATIKLHHQNKERPLDNLWRISVGSVDLEHANSYWWSEPNLSRNDSPRGAKIIHINWHRAWAHPLLLAEEERCAREELEND